jgi:tetratricopeptide (TPR) repeat protein
MRKSTIFFVRSLGLLLFSFSAFAGILAAAATPDAAASPQQQFIEANHALEKGDLDQAEVGYQALLGKGFQGAEFFYNLGNLYYRKGERGRSILFYERALRLAPRDPDIAFNLSLARSHIKDDGDSIFQQVFLSFTITELGWALTMLSWLFFGFLGAGILGWTKAQTWQRIVLWLSGTFLLVTAAWFGVNAVLTHQPWAIVVSPPGEVRNGPGNDYAVGFTIPEGTKVLILNKRPEWMQVGVPQQGLKGWMPSAEVEAITANSVS